MANPYISVITICFNARLELEETLNSVLGQSIDSFESIVVDGRSSDNTCEYLKSIANHRLRWISERDSGIWDAMNKGVLLAKGQYVIFMNAGDKFVDENVLHDVIPYLQISKIFLYGDTIFKTTENRNILIKAGRLADLWKGMIFSHQSFFVPRMDLLASPFGVHDRVADYRWIVETYKSRPELFLHIPRVISIYALGGYSDQHYIKGAIARIPVAVKIQQSAVVVGWYMFFISAEFCKRSVKKLLPNWFMEFYRRFRRYDPNSST